MILSYRSLEQQQMCLQMVFCYKQVYNALVRIVLQAKPLHGAEADSRDAMFVWLLFS